MDDKSCFSLFIQELGLGPYNWDGRCQLARWSDKIPFEWLSNNNVLKYFDNMYKGPYSHSPQLFKYDFILFH